MWILLAGAVGLLLGFLILLALLLPFLINTAAVRERIMADLSRRVQGRVEIQPVALFFLPVPHVTLDQAEISIPDIVHVKAFSLSAYPYPAPPIAPFRTVDAIIRWIPLIGDILEGTLISLPVRVTGIMDDPVVNPVSPTAVRKRMLRIMERTLTLPFRLIDPLLPDDGEDDGHQP